MLVHPTRCTRGAWLASSLCLGLAASSVLMGGLACSSGGGNNGDNSTTLTAPAITSQPQSVARNEGQSASFTVSATGSAPLAYQWKKDGTAIPNALSSTYAINAVQAVDAGSYTVTVSNSAGSATSNAAVLTVNQAVAITTQPTSLTVDVGQPASFSVTASGMAPISYQWAKDGAVIPGATAATYSVAAASASDAGTYTVLVTDATAASVGSQPATLSVNLPPTITTQPQSQSVPAGTSVTLSVSATGVSPFTYQWWKDGSNIPSGTSSTYTIASFSGSDAGSYTVVITNRLGTVTSQAAVLAIGSGILITTQPSSATVNPPDGHTFKVTATGPNLSYQWKNQDGTPIAGASTDSYSIASSDLQKTSASFYCTVSNSGGSVDSNPVTFTVAAPSPIFAGDPISADATRHNSSNYVVFPSYYLTAPADPVQGSFRFGYNTTYKNPVWSSACFFPASTTFVFSRPSSYPTDSRIPASLAQSDYSNTGFSRGHQTPFDQLKDLYGADAGKSSMYMTNMCPQVQALNGGVWQHLETQANVTLPAAFHARVWVYTGPIFAEQLVAPIGAKSIPVPTAFFKVMVQANTGAAPKVLAMIVPHSTTLGSPTVTMQDSDMWKFATTVARVEALTGLNLFPVPPDNLPEGFKSTVDVRGWGIFEQGPSRPNVHMIQPSYDCRFYHTNNGSSSGWTSRDITVTQGTVGNPVTCEAQYTAGTNPVASFSWSFGDGATDVTNLTTTHTYASPNDYTVTFSAKDSLGGTSSISRVLHVVAATGASSQPPSISAINDQILDPASTQDLAFAVADSAKPDGALTVTVASSDPELVMGTVSNAGGIYSLRLTTSAAIRTGTATISVRVANADNQVTTHTFQVQVGPASPQTQTLGDTND